MEPTQITEGNVKRGGIANSPKRPKPIAIPQSQKAASISADKDVPEYAQGEIRHKATTMVNSSLTNNLDNKFIRRVINCDEILHKKEAPTDEEIAWINEEVLEQIRKHTRRKYIIRITNLRKNDLYSSDEPLEKRDVHYYEVFLQPMK